MKKKNSKKIYIKIGMVAILVAAIFGIMWKIAPWKQRVVETPPVHEEQGVKMVRRLIDGVVVEPGKEAPPLAGVMVENMIEAQPLSGVSKASLVFEAVAEANITRFFAVYVLNHDVLEIGPVRSARPYYLDWAGEFNTIYMHVGGSPAAFELLRTKAIKGVHDVDQWYNSKFYAAKAGRPRPHHLYTNTELLKKAYEAMQTTPNPSLVRRGNELLSSPLEGEVRRGLDPWKFKDDAPPDLRGDVKEIHVGYLAPYDVRWQYDKYLNEYTRVQWGGVHKDADGTPLLAKNIAVAFEEMKVLDNVGRKEFKTIGEGRGLVFQDGRVVVGTWKKPSAQERMRWYDNTGKEVEFNTGVTWVEIVPTGYQVTY